MLKEKLVLCPYKVICNEKEFILITEIQDDIEELKKENKESIKIKSPEESTEKAIETKSLEESIEIKSLKEDENTTDSYAKNKLRKISTIVKSDKFNPKTKIGKFKYTDIESMVDNINKNTISETHARKKLNALNELKNAVIKNKRRSSNQKELLKLFDYLLKTISNNNSNNNNNNSNNTTNNERMNENDNENDNDNVNGSESNNKNDNDNVSESQSNNENDNDNVHDYDNDNENENYDDYEIKKINDYFKMIDESISFEDQISLLKIMDDVNTYWNMRYYDDYKELNLKIFKLKYAFLVNDLDEKLFEEILGHTFVTLANKVINATNKEEN